MLQTHEGGDTVLGGGVEVYDGCDGTAFKSLENFVSGTLAAITYALAELASMQLRYIYIILL